FLAPAPGMRVGGGSLVVASARSLAARSPLGAPSCGARAPSVFFLRGLRAPRQTPFARSTHTPPLLAVGGGVRSVGSYLAPLLRPPASSQPAAPRSMASAVTLYGDDFSDLTTGRLQQPVTKSHSCDRTASSLA